MKDERELQHYMKALQNYVNTLSLKSYVDVKLYRSFSSLMQRIMHETNCFDGVYELSGEIANDIRDSLSFPKIGTPNGTPLDIVGEGSLYYLDFNSAYGFAIKGIPTGENGSGPLNTNIADLIKRLYEDRLKFKAANSKLAITLKFLMNSCWGYSIRKPRAIKRRVVPDVNASLNEFGDLVCGFHNDKDSDKSIIHQVRTYVEHFTYPQFAKTVLDTFNNKLQEIASIVNVLYYNVDAILVNESDYNKLYELGYVNASEFGKMKIEKVFSEIHILSARKYYAKDLDGNVIRHLC